MTDTVPYRALQRSDDRDDVITLAEMALARRWTITMPSARSFVGCGHRLSPTGTGSMASKIG